MLKPAETLQQHVIRMMALPDGCIGPASEEALVYKSPHQDLPQLKAKVSLAAAAKGSTPLTSWRLSCITLSSWESSERWVTPQSSQARQQTAYADRRVILSHSDLHQSTYGIWDLFAYPMPTSSPTRSSTSRAIHASYVSKGWRGVVVSKVS